MRTVKSDTGRTYQVRGLTRREVRSLREDHDIDLMNIDRGNADSALDHVLKLVLSEHDFADIDDEVYSLTLDIWTAALAETFGSRDEEKNLSRSGNGSQTRKE